MESNGLYLDSAGSRAGGQFLMVANQSSQHQSTVMVDHTFVFKITDEEGVNYYHWLVSHNAKLLNPIYLWVGFSLVLMKHWT